MPLNAAIPLSYNPTVALDMAGAKQNALVNQALMQKNMLAYRQAQQDQAQQNFMNDAYGRAYDPASGQIDYNQMQALAAAGGRGGLIPGMLNQRAERDKATGEARKAQLELFNEGLKARQSLLSPNMSPEEYISWHEGNHTDPIVGPMLSQMGVKPGDRRAKIIDRIKKGELPQLIAESAMGIQKLSERNTLTAEQQSMATDRAAGRTNAAGQLAEMQRHNRATENEQTLAGPIKLRREATTLRKEFDALPEVKNFKSALPVLVSARNAPDTAAGDIDLAYAVGKIYDPNSVVRESEQKLVYTTGSVLQNLIGGAGRALAGGTRLPHEVRQKLINALNNRVLQLRQSYDQVRNTYSEYATESGFNPTNVTGQHPASAFKPSDPPNDSGNWKDVP